MDPLFCYLTVTTTQNQAVSTYQIPLSRAKQLSTQCGFFKALYDQHRPNFNPGAGQPVPTMQTALPSPNTFDVLLHWLYHRDMVAVHKALAAGLGQGQGGGAAFEAFFGVVRNAAHLGIYDSAEDIFWDVMAAWAADKWLKGLRDCPKWTWTIIPIVLAARAAIAVGGGGVGGDMMAKWASGDQKVADRGLEEVKKVLALYRSGGSGGAASGGGQTARPPAQNGGRPPQQQQQQQSYDDDDDVTVFGDEDDGEDLGGFMVYEPAPELMGPLADDRRKKRKKRRGLLTKFKDLMVKEEQVLLATVVVVRDSKGRVVDEKVIRHKK
ncbi:uncharacterized protein EV422DRAFT_507794 [Fimicolochytrium jonesii]|uniref:uncharacterized protein n=1 Tax=Fimicolochytrium jonesii TaxID=1396493 RepID=UPI0022FDCA44|nr:uncharacterized protein EV422DRAFT_507794 [Fimicolochytrium jonesii]KAI8818980.1 hypothetical protein EV422DRAFT_507794 [Fimicolochytrium jonesii]